jgi:mannan endo-1,4-beta-mannosidase
MRNGLATRLKSTLSIALVGVLVLGAGAATASKGSGSERLQSAEHPRLRVANAHKVRGANRCFERRARRARTARRRRPSCPRPAEGRSAPQPLYWGATIGSHLTGSQAPWDMTAVTKFEEDAKKSVSLVQFFQPFANCASSPCSFYSFPTAPLEDIREHGAIPVLSWSSQSIPSTTEEPDFQLSDVIAGNYDEYIRGFAESARSWGHPFFLRFNWEMNGDWFPWSEGVNGNLPGEYVAAWRRVHDIFATVGASNVTWIWCPFVDPKAELTSLGSQYPGDSYVDWSCLDGYNWGRNPVAPKGWKSFDEQFESTYREVVERIAPSKPMMIGEVGSSEQGGSKPAWIADALAKVPSRYQRVRALLWFDKFDSGMDWPIETSAAATDAFAQGIQDPMYVGNRYAEVAPGPILPPS